MVRMRGVLFLVVMLAACGSWSRVGGDGQQPVSETLTDLFDTYAFFQRIGRLSASGALPFVGDVAFAGGPNDSTVAIVGLSLQNRALGFQREGDGFVARYSVALTLAPADGRTPLILRRDEAVRVASFVETQRADESVLFQQSFHIPPGEYTITASLRDPATGASSEASRSVTAPRFGAGSTTAPLLIYQVRGRSQLSDTLSLVLNPRGSVLYGGDTLLIYVEGYEFTGQTQVPVELQDDRDSVVFRDSLSFRGGSPVEGHVLKFRPDSVALGALRLTVGQGTSAKSTTALVSFSNSWIVTNYVEMTELLRYFGEDVMLDSIRNATDEARPSLWARFWRETDPDKTTPENEALNDYFTRLTIANRRYRTEGVPGWRTDRGEVFISLGEPDETFENSPGQLGGRILVWNYVNLRLQLYFVDESSFGRYRLEPSSRSDFERVRLRLRRLSD